MGKKKKFIDKKKSATFQLLVRDSSDPNYTDGTSGDRIFVRVDGNSDKSFFDEHDGELNDCDDPNGIFDDAPDDYSDEEEGGRDRDCQKQTAGQQREGVNSLPDYVRREILELGFPDDGYNYLLHLREIGNTGGGSSFYQNPKAKLHHLPRDVKAYDASRIDISKADDDSYENAIYGVATKTIPVRVQKAIDPDVAALLDDSYVSRFGSDVEDLEEDFVLTANLPEESGVVLDAKLTFTKGSKVGKKDNESNAFCSQDNVVGRSGSVDTRNGNHDGNATVVSAEPRLRRPLDEQFDMLELQEYGTDSEDEYDKAISEEDEYHESLAEKLSHVHVIDSLETDGKYKVLLHDKKIAEEPVSLETAADLVPRCKQYAEKYENEDDNEDIVLEESSDEPELWDCETIISTYSNLDNHPAKIEAPGTRQKKKLDETVSKAFTVPTHTISLKGKEKLPVDFLPQRTPAAEKVKDKGKLKNEQPQKKKHGQESKQEKKEWKAAVKEEKREARRAKKGLKELYKVKLSKLKKSLLSPAHLPFISCKHIMQLLGD